jgi:hypothetical protein
MRFSEVNDDFALLMGGRIGLVLNRIFVIGGAGYGLVNEIEAGPADRVLDFGYGGLFLEYINRPHKLMHLSVHSLIGLGGLRYRPYDYEWDDRWHADALFVLEPGMDVELNITKHIRIGLGGSYRLVSGVDLEGLEGNDLSGPTASMTFKLGRF